MRPRSLLLAALLWGAAAIGRAEEPPSVLILSSEATERSEDIVKTFKERMTGTTRFSFTLEGSPDAGAFVADSMRDLNFSLVFTVGDEAMKVAAREFAGVPMVYTDASDLTAVLGRSDVQGVSLRTDPAHAVQRLRLIAPDLGSLGAVKAITDNDSFWADLEQGCAEVGIELVLVEATGATDVSAAVLSLAHQVDAVWLVESPALWSPSLVARALVDLHLQGVLAIGYAEPHLVGSHAAGLVIKADPDGVAAVAAAMARRRLKTGEESYLTRAEPIFVGNLDALRHSGIRITRKNAVYIEDWVSPQRAP